MLAWLWALGAGAWALEAEHDAAARFRAASLVVAVEVADEEVRYEPEVPGGVATVALSRPLAVAKGAPPEVIEVVLPGGRLDGVRVEVDGVPRLPPGSQWLLYLAPAPGGGWGVVGAEAGAVRLSGSLSAERAVAEAGQGRQP
jgi:hypothetical protein